MVTEIRYDSKRVVNLNNLWVLKIPSAVDSAVKAVQEFGAAMRGIKYPQLFGRAYRPYQWYITRYQSQPADLRRATQLEF